MYENELYHHGILGMKWGVRRYQNADGSLTYAGKKRALKIQDKYTSFTEDQKYRKKDGDYTYAGRKKALKMREQYSAVTGGKKLTKFTPSSNSKKQKTISEMSDEELRKKVDRMRIEKDYIDLKRQMSSITPKHISMGRKFVNKVTNDVIIPAATDTAKQVVKSYMTKTVNDRLNLDGDLKVYTNNKKKS